MGYGATEHHLYGLIIWEGQLHHCQGIPSLLLQAITRGYIEGTELSNTIFTGKRGRTVAATLSTTNIINIEQNRHTLIVHVFDWWGVVPISECRKQWPKLIEAHLHLLKTLPVPNDLQADLDYQATCEAIGITANHSFQEIGNYLATMRAKANEHYVYGQD